MLLKDQNKEKDKLILKKYKLDKNLDKIIYNMLLNNMIFIIGNIKEMINQNMKLLLLKWI